MSDPIKASDLDQLKQRLSELGESERRVLHQIVARLHGSRSVYNELDENQSRADRLADQIAAFGGSWTFVLLFLGLLLGWVVLNGYILAQRGTAFDPYPFILLNLFLSTVAALQAPVILMSQNRQAARDRLTAEHDYEVNLKAEMEILRLHEKIDQLRREQWRELITQQEEQLELLKRLVGDNAS